MGVIGCILNWSRCGDAIRQELFFRSPIVMGAAAAIFLIRHHASLPFINDWREPLELDSLDALYLLPAGIFYVLLHIFV